MAGPIDVHPLRSDPVSAGAHQVISVGDRKLVAVSDGFFRMPADFLGTTDHPHAAHDVLQHAYGEVRLPLGCFVWPGEQTALIDTGFGPSDYGGLGLMVGGRLLEQLDELGLPPEAVDVVTLSHLHSDHIGWIADAAGNPIFTNATIYLGERDWEHFINGGSDPAPPANVLHGLKTLAERGQVELLDGEKQVTPGLTRLAAPGHTPGHSVYVIHDGGERVLLLGDAMYCPHQLTNEDWEATSDVDPELAAQTRRRFVRDLEQHGGSALGCHFPELIVGRALARREAIQ